jgi:hypothetical protein
MTTTYYTQQPPSSNEAAGAFEKVFFKVPVSVCFDVLPIQTASPHETTVARVKPLPRAQNGRFSFRDMLSVLDDAGLAEFNQQGIMLHNQLRKRYERGEVSALFFYRSLAHMTQEQLAIRARSRQSFISQLEKQRRPLTWKQAKKFAPALGVLPAQLMECA